MSRVRPAASERKTWRRTTCAGSGRQGFRATGRPLQSLQCVGLFEVAESRGLARSVLNATHRAYRRIAALAAVHGQLRGACGTVGTANLNRVSAIASLLPVASTEQAAMKCLYLVTRSLDPKGTGQTRWATRWLSRPGAQCRHYCRSVSPGRSPNRACASRRTRLSTVSCSEVSFAGRGWGSSRPGIGNG